MQADFQAWLPQPEEREQIEKRLLILSRLEYIIPCHKSRNVSESRDEQAHVQEERPGPNDLEPTSVFCGCGAEFPLETPLEAWIHSATQPCGNNRGWFTFGPEKNGLDNGNAILVFGHGYSHEIAFHQFYFLPALLAFLKEKGFDRFIELAIDPDDIHYDPDNVHDPEDETDPDTYLLDIYGYKWEYIRTKNYTGIAELLIPAHWTADEVIAFLTHITSLGHHLYTDVLDMFYQKQKKLNCNRALRLEMLGIWEKLGYMDNFVGVVEHWLDVERVVRGFFFEGKKEIFVPSYPTRTTNSKLKVDPNLADKMDRMRISLDSDWTLGWELWSIWIKFERRDDFLNLVEAWVRLEKYFLLVNDFNSHGRMES